MDSRQEEFRRRLLGLGFDEVRFAAVAPPLGDPLRAWIDAGHHADLHWMERTVEKRLDPAQVLPGVKSIVLLGVSYWSDATASRPRPNGAPAWARYALHEDYHDTIAPALAAAGRQLEEIFQVGGTDYRYYVDTGPVLERSWAARAGLGFTGKNAMLISRRHGNWLLLAALLTRVDFVADLPIATARPDLPVGRLCGHCTRCLVACPTGAFPAPGVLDARRCVSYQTIENKGVIPRELRAGIGQRVFGCDACLEVCPWNRFARTGRQVLLAARPELGDLTVAELLVLTPERFAAVFRRTPIKRLKLTGLLRNACVVAGNSGDRSLLPALVALATTHPSALVRAHAVWAVHRLDGAAALASHRLVETDPSVRAEYAAEA
ncbi:MAG: tRNA epoxyqueuosine(34) reductase QueG [Verrucomicrobia bacterium]|nr:tRNA epoxyqueuosine(34) reductase QueG [Verrucomicrobiota bacterium]